MIRLFSISALCFAALTGCATTEKLTSKVSFGGSDTPMQQVIKAQPSILKNQNSMSVRQVFNRVENPTAAQIAVIDSNLLDDSVNAIRTDYIFKRVENAWKLQETKKTYQCRRGNSREFQTQLCS
ncbi:MULTISPECIES: hypothetical protein [unclassified Acinetobacter]|uniref:hypothetical protein n=1 Tax=unclassified Acinetobacter TaxID=196816 RepID=UPI0025760035|nr:MULTISPECIES: hypothetical protein [unclassified Acinetobacter]MDM1246047.1 hypothetical protein [Acinetobacter sp. R933-2]MDM1764078.1 hypothetical protein [Acinetobacter sp. 226-1]MDM1769009.1 hypothetical protein [Acinetobacter sp. 226-4]